MKFEHSVLSAAFNNTHFEVPQTVWQHSDRMAVTLHLAHSWRKWSTDEHLALILEPLCYIMKERFGETLQPSTVMTGPFFTNPGAQSSISVKVLTQHPQEMMDILGDMYGGMKKETLFVGISDKCDVLLPRQQQEIPKGIVMPEPVRGVLKMAADGYKR